MRTTITLYIATALIMVVGLIAAPVKADEHDDNIALWETVNEIVPVWDNSPVDHCSNDVYGAYNMTTNEMVICNGLDYDQFYDTLKHEAIHLAQDCIAGGLHTDGGITLFEHLDILNNLTPYVIEMLKLYDDIDMHVWFLEAEAFILESYGSDYILDLLNESCI